MSSLSRAMLILMMLAITGTGMADGDPQCQQHKLIIREARLWIDDAFQPAQDLVIDQGRIIAIQAAGSARDPDAKLIDAEGQRLIPGLIDLHTHFFELGGPLPAAVVEADIPRNFTVIARHLLLSGVTSARAHLMNLQHGPTLAAQAARPCAVAPHIEFAGPGLFGGMPEVEAFQVWGVNGPEDGQAKVERIAASGARWLSIHRPEQFLPGELDAIVHSARAHKLRLLGAGNSPEAILALLPYRPDTIDYLPTGVAAELPENLRSALAQSAQQHGQGPPVFVPMISPRIIDARLRQSPAALDLTPLVGELPRAVTEDLAQRLTSHFEKAQGEPAEHNSVVAFGAYRALGLPLAIGTDSGSPAHFHRLAIWHEMAAWQARGVPAGDILRAATVVPAQVMGRQDIGVIRVGARADLVLYRGQLEAGELSVEHVALVIRNGIPHRPE